MRPFQRLDRGPCWQVDYMDLFVRGFPVKRQFKFDKFKARLGGPKSGVRGSYLASARYSQCTVSHRALLHPPARRRCRREVKGEDTDEFTTKNLTARSRRFCRRRRLPARCLSSVYGFYYHFNNVLVRNVIRNASNNYMCS